MAAAATTACFGPSEAPSKLRWTTRDLVILAAVAAIDGADVQLLPSSFRAMETDLGLRPSDLSRLLACQGVAMALAGPFWGNLADSGFPRRLLLASGSLVWGICTFLLAFTSDYAHMMLLRAVNGMALGALLPVVQAIVADRSEATDRGHYFGVIEFSQRLLGQGVAAAVVAGVSNQQIFGMAGWRASFIGVAACSVLMAVIVPLCMDEPKREWKPERVSFSREVRNFSSYLRMPTFQVLVAQGLVGNIPWQAASFAVMYLQYVGLSDLLAGLITANILVGASLGAVFGGWFGDALSRWSPNHGRPIVAQLSVALGIPFAIVIVSCVPRDASYVVTYFVLHFGLGITASWPKTGVNQPIYSEIVSDNQRSSIIAWSASLEGASGALLGPTSVGYLSEVLFGYTISQLPVSEMLPEARLANADALGKSLMWCACVPWALCWLLYGFLHLTYGKDRALAKRAAALQANDCEALGALAAGEKQACETTALLARKD